MPVDTELQEAIDNAAVEITGKPLTELTESGSDPGDENSESDSQEVQDESQQTSENEEAELSESEVVEAQKLYKLLKNPQTGADLVAAMANRYGILGREREGPPPETRKEVKVAKKEIKAIFEEALGANFKFLAEPLGKAIDQVLAQEREDYQVELGETRVQQALSETNRVLESLSKETNGQSRQFENRMADLMIEYPMQSHGNVEKYLRDMLSLASAGKLKQNASKTVADKVRRNANNVSDRLGGKGGLPGGETLPSKKLSLTESIQWAQKQLGSQAGKKR